MSTQTKEAEARIVFSQQEKIAEEVIERVKDKLGLEPKKIKKTNDQIVYIEFKEDETKYGEFTKLLRESDWKRTIDGQEYLIQALSYGGFSAHIEIKGIDNNRRFKYICESCNLDKLKDEENNKFYCPICD